MSKPQEVRPIFLYLTKCKLAEDDLKKLRDSGYIPIGVQSFDHVKVVEALTIGASSAIAKAAYKAIADRSTYEQGAQTDFGRLAARALSEPSK